METKKHYLRQHMSSIHTLNQKKSQRYIFSHANDLQYTHFLKFQDEHDETFTEEKSFLNYSHFHHLKIIFFISLLIRLNSMTSFVTS